MDGEERPDRPLRLLSLDGGGVRGLSSLIILKYLMKLVNSKKPPKPCEHFDLICGTSTGGLIAIMLGRLQMSIDECIDAYQKLAGKIFQRKRSRANIFGRAKDNWNLEGAFDSGKLTQAIKDIVKQSGLPVDTKLMAVMESEASSQCKVFVCAIRTEINKPVLLRSYTTDDTVDEISCTIWEAGRATSAATSFFSHIDIGSQRFTDGATECNNPVEFLIEEAHRIWPNAISRTGRILKAEAHMRLAVVCLRYLNSPDHQSRSRADNNPHEFLDYALQFTTYHIFVGSTYEESLYDELRSFFGRGQWTREWGGVQKPGLEHKLSLVWSPSCTSLASFACRLGLSNVLRRELELGWSDPQCVFSHTRCIRASCAMLYESFINQNEDCLVTLFWSLPPMDIQPGTLDALLDFGMEPLPQTVVNLQLTGLEVNEHLTAFYQDQRDQSSLELSRLQSLLHRFQMDPLGSPIDQATALTRAFEPNVRQAYRRLVLSTESEKPQLFRSPSEAGVMLRLALLLCVFLNITARNELTSESSVFGQESSAVLELVRRGQCSAVEVLLQEGAGISAQDTNGASVLHWAARSGDRRLVELILKQGSLNVNGADHFGSTALHYACSPNHLYDIQVFAEARPPNVSRVEVIRALIAAGTQPRLCNFRGATPVQLLGRVSVPDLQEGRLEVQWRQVDLLESLDLLIVDLDDVLRWDPQGATVLHYAAYNWPCEAVQYLVNYLERFHIAATLLDHMGCTPLHYAAARKLEDAPEVIDISITGVDVRVRDVLGDSALDRARQVNNRHAIDQLLTVQKIQTEARRQALEEYLYRHWVDMDKTPRDSSSSAFQSMLGHITRQNSPILHMMHLGRLSDSYSKHPSTEYITLVQSEFLKLFFPQKARLGPTHLQIQVPMSQKEDLIVRFEGATSNMLFRLSELDRCWNPLAGVQSIPLYRPILPDRVASAESLPAHVTTQLEHLLSEPSPTSRGYSFEDPHDAEGTHPGHASRLEARMEEMKQERQEYREELDQRVHGMIGSHGWSPGRSEDHALLELDTSLSVGPNNRPFVYFLLYWLMVYALYLPSFLLVSEAKGMFWGWRIWPTWGNEYDTCHPIPERRGWVFEAWIWNRWEYQRQSDEMPNVRDVKKGHRGKMIL